MRRKLFISALAAICLVFASGVVVGVVGRRAFQPIRSHSLLVEELDLTPDQRYKLRQIWGGVAKSRTPVSREELEKVDAERWQAIDQLLTPEQREKYERLLARPTLHFLYLKKSTATEPSPQPSSD